MSTTDTIVAIATPPGRGGVGIVRLSGPIVGDIAKKIIGRLPAPRYAAFRCFRDVDESVLDQGLALYFPSPHSFTGEDVFEFHAHGGPVILDLLLKRCTDLGARIAHPGEFSLRAFCNNKLDLTQAEAIADMIDSGTEAAARSAARSLVGEFSKKIKTITEAIIQLRSYVEAAIDFPQEEIDFLADSKIDNSLQTIYEDATDLLREAKQGRLMREGLSLVLAGPPNAGKSSLLNVLVQFDAAIVNQAPGTTRDLLREQISLDGLPLLVIDTAGLRGSEDEVEAEGIRRAKQAISQADHCLLIVDDSLYEAIDIDKFVQWLPSQTTFSVVRNKIDLSHKNAAVEIIQDISHIFISAKTGTGLDLLKTHIKHCAGYNSNEGGNFIARRRHIVAMTRAIEHLQSGHQQLKQAAAGELLAEDLRQAQLALNEITGEFASEDLLGRIFSDFCIGK